VIEAAVRETCKHRQGFECATLLAVWRRHSSRPEKIEAYLRQLRRDWNIDVNRDTNLDVIDALLSGETRSVEESLSLGRATMISKRFSSYYHHAFPFDRRALRAAWDACRGEACASERRRFEDELGALDLPAVETK